VPLRFRYGAYLSKEQVAELVAPHPDTLELVNSWLEHHGISLSSVSRTHGGGWLTVTNVPVSQANDLLGASYQLYRHTGTNETVTILRTVGYALPAALHAHVQAVVPTTYFNSPRMLQQTPRKRSRGETAVTKNATSGKLVTVLSRRNNDDDDDDDDEVDPPFLRWLYKTAAYVPAATDNNMLGVVGYDDSYPNQADLKTFMNEFSDSAEAAIYKVAQVNGGGNDPSDPGDEATVNIQYTTAMAHPTPLTFYSTGGHLAIWKNEPAPGDGFLEWLNYILNEQKIPQTISIPYGNEELYLPLEYATTLCDLFAQLGSRGVSVLFSSGDDGVGRGNCIDKSGKVQFHLLFPASCARGIYFSLQPTHKRTNRLPDRHVFAGPYVTSVGGTTGGTTDLKPESAAPLSQGGFSLHFARPSYQDGVVTTFLQNLGSKYSGLYKYARCRDPTRPILTL